MDTKPLAFIIEDNEDQNLIFTMALKQAGYVTESILDGAIAQKRLSEAVPMIVILDLHIPYVDGSILLSQIRSDPRLSSVNVILATADAVFAKQLESKAELFLLKPVSFSQLSELTSRFNPNKEPGDSSSKNI